MPFMVYKGTTSSDTLLEASDITINLLIDGIDNATFTLDNSSTTLARGDKCCIYGWLGAPTTYTRQFIGSVESISLKHPRRVTLLSPVEQMRHYIVAEAQSKTLKGSGKILGIKAGDDTSLELGTDESVALDDLTNDQYNSGSYYLLVSDNTSGNESLALQNGANNYIGYDHYDYNFGSHTNDHTVVTNTEFNTAADNDCFYASKSSPTMGTAYGLGIALNIDESGSTGPILDHETISRISIVGQFEVIATGAYRAQADVYLSCSATNSAEGMASVLVRMQNFNPVSIPGSGTFDETYAINVDFPVWSISNHFTDGADNWENGYLGLFVKPLAGERECTLVKIIWKSVKCTLYYTSRTLPHDVNSLITDTTAPNIITTSGTDYDDAGTGIYVSAGDNWAIGIDYKLALENTMSPVAGMTGPDFPLIVNNGNAIGLGVAKNFFGCTGFEMFEQLLKDLNMHYWFDHTYYTLVCDDYAGMTHKTTNLNNPDPRSNVTIDQYPMAYVAVIWHDDIEIAATEVSGAVGCHKEADEGILTRDEALRRLDALKTQYSVYQYAINLIYNNLRLNQWVATGNTYDVTVDGVEYTEQPCRRIMYWNDGGTATYRTNIILGMGSTPPEEKLVKAIGQLQKAEEARKFKFLSSSYTPITRHNSLDGIAGDEDGYHLSSSDYTAINGDLKAPKASPTFSGTVTFPSTYTSANYEAHLLIGAANAAYIPCAFQGSNVPAKLGLWNGAILNTDGSDQYFDFICPLPTNRGGLKLYVKGWRFIIGLADATDYVTEVYVFGDEGAAAIDDDGTDLNSAGTKSKTFTAVDCSSYGSIGILINCVLATGGEFRMATPQLLCYYGP